MASRYIEQGWDAYRRIMLPDDMDEGSLHHLRRAYYSGAAVLFHTIMHVLDPGDEPTVEDLARMSGLQAELDEFGQQLDAEILGSMMRKH